MRILAFAALLFLGAACLQVAFVLFAFGEMADAAAAGGVALVLFAAAGSIHEPDAPADGRDPGGKRGAA